MTSEEDTKSSESKYIEEVYKKFAPPPPPEELPERFLGAGKGDPEEGQRRYEQTLAWRKENDMDYILRKPRSNFEMIHDNYPHYYHLRGKNNEPVWYEKPPKINLKEMRKHGVTVDELLDYYAMVTEFGWQYLEPDDSSKSITVIDLDGIRMMDFMGDAVDFTRKASHFTGQHYPERAAYVLVINVPSWFKMIWSVVQSFVDEVTLKKIKILRGEEEILDAMKELIPLENIPPEYGGTSMPLGESPEEKKLIEFVAHNNSMAKGEISCETDDTSTLCTWKPSRAY